MPASPQSTVDLPVGSPPPSFLLSSSALPSVQHQLSRLLQRLLDHDREVRRSVLHDIRSLFFSLWEQDQANAVQLARDNLVKLTILANKTPYRSVRTFLSTLLDWMETTLSLVPPQINRTCCTFVSIKDTVPLTTETPEPERILRETWVQNGRITNLEQILLWHPSYLNRHQRTIHLLMNEQAPLPLPWRIYIALASVARHRCRYLIGLLETQYTTVGGDLAWLRGIQFLPEKLHKILDVVQILAHQPWTIKPDHVDGAVPLLARGGDQGF